MNMPHGMPMDANRMQFMGMPGHPGRMPGDLSKGMPPGGPYGGLPPQHQGQPFPGGMSMPMGQPSNTPPVSSSVPGMSGGQMSLSNMPASTESVQVSAPVLTSSSATVSGSVPSMYSGPSNLQEGPDGMSNRAVMEGGTSLMPNRMSEPIPQPVYPGGQITQHPGQPSSQGPAAPEPVPAARVSTTMTSEAEPPQSVIPQAEEEMPSQTNIEDKEETPKEVFQESSPPSTTVVEDDVNQTSSEPVSQSNDNDKCHEPSQSDNVPESSTEKAIPTSTSDDNEKEDAKMESDNEEAGDEQSDKAEPDTTVKQPLSDGSAPSTSTVGMPPQGQSTVPCHPGMPPGSMGPNGPVDPRMLMDPNGQMHPGMHPGMRGPFPPPGFPNGPPMSQAGGGPMNQPRMMMGPNGPVPVGPGGSMGMLPPNHPIIMEMQALHQHIQQLYTQPQNKANQQKVNISFIFVMEMVVNLTCNLTKTN